MRCAVQMLLLCTGTKEIDVFKQVHLRPQKHQSAAPPLSPLSSCSQVPVHVDNEYNGSISIPPKKKLAHTSHRARHVFKKKIQSLANIHKHNSQWIAEKHIDSVVFFSFSLSPSLSLCRWDFHSHIAQRCERKDFLNLSAFPQL